MFSALTNLSSGEVDYITTSCQRDMRMDGRSCLEPRPYTLEINVIPTASGSARIRIESANILAVVKLDVGSFKQGEPMSQLVRTSVDVKNPCIERSQLSALVSSLSSEIKNFILQTELIKSDHLIIIPGKQAWFLSIDVTVFSSCGNIFDLSLLATRAALATASIPALRVMRKTNIKTKEIEHNLELIPGSVVPLGIWDKHFPLSLSLCVLNDTIIIDPTDNEEACIGSRYLVGFDRQGHVVGHTKVGITGLSPQLYIHSLEIANQVGSIIYRYYLKALSQAIERDGKTSGLMKKLFQKLGPQCPLPDGLDFDPEAIHQANSKPGVVLGAKPEDDSDEELDEDDVVEMLEEREKAQEAKAQTQKGSKSDRKNQN